ncbi:hypothetical protein [Paenibacillus agri]|uniref:DUF4306 domain-containing protein n=1 Tax=Paenibacillus agri TaxID=2744309 RepID=A0A850EFH2_9BACL|nr:hypothetical protein [Paenibacillus agri]NUU59895.1 hypothetical protein [Paenibacillus agri]
MKRLRSTMLAIYSAILFIVGILRVPVTAHWGPKNQIDHQRFVALWELQATDKHQTIDNYYPIYELDIVRVIYTILIVSLLMYSIYLALSSRHK